MAEIVRRETAYQGYSTIERITARVGGEEIGREVESHGRAAAVLLYDPERCTALLTRQFRPAVKLAAGADALLEPVAGMVEGEDTAEATIRREAMEEVGVRPGAVERIAVACPGVSTESVALYLAAFNPADRVGAGGGVAGEHEQIEVIETPLHPLATLGDGEAAVDVKLLVLIQALRLRRPALFDQPAESAKSVRQA